MSDEFNLSSESLSNFSLNEMINLNEIQRLQDLFSEASGVASIITHPDGKPITNPTNFCNLCKTIRKSVKGRAKCIQSNELIGRYHPNGPNIQMCLTCGLWHAGASITIGNKHIANWIIGQVRIEEKEEHALFQYADDIGANREDFIKAMKEVPLMSLEQFTRVSKMLFAFANEFSEKAYSNFQLKRQIAERDEAIRQRNEAEEQYQTLFDRSNDAIFLVSFATGNYLNANPAAEILTGRSLDELKKLKTFDLTPKDAGKRLERLTGINETTKLGEVEYHRSDGTNRTVLLSSIPLNKGLAFGIAHDVSEQKRLDQALTDSNAITEATLESIHNGILVVSDHGAVIKTNAKFAELWQIPKDVIASGDDKTLLEYILEQLINPDQFIAKVNEVYDNPEAESIDSIYLKDGRIFNRISKPFYLGGQPKGRVWSFLDITKQKQTEETIYNERLLLRTLIDNIPDSIYCKDLACCKTLVNRVEIHYMNAKSEAEILGKDDFAFYPKELAEQFFIDDQLVIQTGTPVLNREEYVIDEKGQKRWLLTSKLPLRDKENQIVGLIGIGRDITYRKRAEIEIKLKNEQLIMAHAEKDKFFSIIAHDLRNPLSSFLGLTQIIDEQLSTLSSDEIRQFTHSMRNTASNLYRLLENLLQWATMQRGLIPFNPMVIQLRSMIDESIATAMEPAKSKGIDIDYRIPDDINVFADINLLQTVIRNLVSNAMKFTPRGGNIRLSAIAQGDNYIEISIADTGIGMSKSILENLFRPDVRTGRPGTEGEPSTGLGLLLCKEFVEKHGGKIRVESEEGKGSVFYFTIPSEDKLKVETSTEN